MQKRGTGGSDPGVWHCTGNAADQLTRCEEWESENGARLKSAALDCAEAGNWSAQNVIVAVTQAVMPLIRAGHGRVVLMGSNSGFMCEPFLAG